MRKCHYNTLWKVSNIYCNQFLDISIYLDTKITLYSRPYQTCISSLSELTWLIINPFNIPGIKFSVVFKYIFGVHVLKTPKVNGFKTNSSSIFINPVFLQTQTLVKKNIKTQQIINMILFLVALLQNWITDFFDFFYWNILHTGKFLPLFHFFPICPLSILDEFNKG